MKEFAERYNRPSGKTLCRTDRWWRLTVKSLGETPEAIILLASALW